MISRRNIVSIILVVISLTSISYAQSDTTRIQPAPKTKKINPTGALFRSAFVPGWGQYYNKRYIKGTIIAAGESYLIYGIVTNWRASNKHKKNFENTDDITYKASEFALYEKTRDKRNKRMWILAAVVFYSMFDAYVDAQLSDFSETDKAYEVYLEPSSNDGVVLTLNLKLR
jgi:hypothetical protein